MKTKFKEREIEQEVEKSTEGHNEERVEGRFTLREWHDNAYKLIPRYAEEISIDVDIEVTDLEWARHVFVMSYLPEGTVKATVDMEIQPRKRPNEPLEVRLQFFEDVTTRIELKHLSLFLSVRDCKDLEKYEVSVDLGRVGWQCPKLESLTLYGEGITEIKVDKNNSCHSFQHLQSIMIQDTRAKDIDLSFLRNTPVRTVYIEGNKELSSIDLTPLIYCERLQDETQSVTLYNSEGTFQVSELVHLEDVDARKRLWPIVEYLSDDTKCEINQFLRGATDITRIEEQLLEHRKITEPAVTQILEIVSTRFPQISSSLDRLEQFAMNPVTSTTSLSMIHEDMQKIIDHVDKESAEKSRLRRIWEFVKELPQRTVEKAAVDHSTEKVLLVAAAKTWEFLKVALPLLVAAALGG